MEDRMSEQEIEKIPAYLWLERRYPKGTVYDLVRNIEDAVLKRVGPLIREATLREAHQLCEEYSRRLVSLELTIELSISWVLPLGQAPVPTKSWN